MWAVLRSQASRHGIGSAGPEIDRKALLAQLWKLR